jgi:hypothetical protein
MIKISKFIAPDRDGVDVECATVPEAVGQLEPELKIVIARCGSDREFLGLVAATLKRAQTAVEMGVGDAVWIWQPVLQVTDGDGWRLIFEQSQALTAQGQQKQAAQQQAQAQQMMRQMGGGGGFKHPGDGQRGNGMRR